MLRRYASPLLPALAITAIALTGCGGSSKKPSTSTRSTAPGSTSGGASSLNSSTSLNAPLAQRLFREEGVTHGLPASLANKFVSCLENKFASQGIRTFGDASGHQSEVRLDSAACALDVKTGG